jgi:hypothetical protein
MTETTAVAAPLRILDEMPQGGSRLGWNLIGVLTGLIGVAALAAWILSSYFRIDVAGSMSFHGADGWCSAPPDGLGIHCWGDYSAIRFNSLTAPPQGAEIVYPLSTRLIRAPFMLLEGIAGFQAGLLAFIIASALAVLAPAAWAVRKVQWPLKPVVVTASCVVTMPFLVLFDRANIIALAVPFVFLFLLALVRERPWLAVACLVVASSIKPQFIVLGLALVTLRHWRPAVVGLIGSGAAIVLPFLLMGNGWLSALTTWMDQSRAWSASQPLAADWPPNLSIAKVLFESLQFFVIQPDSYFVGLTLVFTLAICVVIAVTGRHLHPLLVGTVFLTIACLAMPISYAYYSFFAIPILALVFRLGFTPSAFPSRWDTPITALLSAGLVVTLSPILIPVGILGPAQLDGQSLASSLTPRLSSVIWTLFLVASAILSIANWRSQVRPGMHVPELVDDERH